MGNLWMLFRMDYVSCFGCFDFIGGVVFLELFVLMLVLNCESYFVFSGVCFVVYCVVFYVDVVDYGEGKVKWVFLDLIVLGCDFVCYVCWDVIVDVDYVGCC